MTRLSLVPSLALSLMLTGAMAPPAPTGTLAGKCARGWAGALQYTKAQSDSRSKSVPRISGKGVQTTNWTMTYDYAAQIALREAPSAAGSGAAKAKINALLTSAETISSNDQHMCSGERQPRTMSGVSTTRSEARAHSSGEDATVGVTLGSNGAYSIGIALPSIPSTISGSSSSSYSGQCVPKQGSSRNLAGSSGRIDAVSFSTGGTDRIQPSDPDRLTGSFSKTYQNVTETLRWDLRRCGAPLRLVDMKFEDMKFPNWNAWKEIQPESGTIDGNIVKIKAVVANDSGEDKSATIRFRDTYQGDKASGNKPDGLLEEFSVDVPAGETKEVDFTWDTSGYAWYEDGRPRFSQRIKAELWEESKKADELVRNLKIAPRPLVLVHGLWANWTTWQTWQGKLATAHSFAWRAFPVGEEAQFGKMNTGDHPGSFDQTNTISQNAQELAGYIKYAQENRNAWHVDIIAHSMGGLISRRYIHQTMPTYPDGKPQIAHLVMLGTPNMGSPCADLISAPLEGAGRRMEALRELRPDVVAQFNTVNVNRKGVEFSVLAGNPVPTICYAFGANDGVVFVPSATWTIADNAQKGVLHTDMTGSDEVFSTFVMPRIAIGPSSGPRGIKLPKPGRISYLAPLRHSTEARTANLLASPAILQSRPSMRNTVTVKPDFSEILKLAPGQSVEIPIPIGDVRNFGLSFVASPQVSATLFDNQGKIQGENRAASPEAAALFRSFFLDRPIKQGVWKLRFENTGTGSQEIVLAAWSNAH